MIYEQEAPRPCFWETKLFHLWAVISVSMKRNPSNLGANFSVEAEPSEEEEEEEPPWPLWAAPSCENRSTHIKIRTPRPAKTVKIRTFRCCVSDPHGLKRNLKRKRVKFWGKVRVWRKYLNGDLRGGWDGDGGGRRGGDGGCEEAGFLHLGGRGRGCLAA